MLLVVLLLPALGRDALAEVPLRIHEADADERHAEVAGFLAVIAREHAQAAGVDRQRLVERELGARSTRRRSAPRRAELRLPPRVARRRAHRIDAPQRAASYSARNAGSAARRARASPAMPLQHHHRVVRGLTPERIVEPPEYVAAGVPGPPEVVREFGEPGRGGRADGQSGRQLQESSTLGVTTVDQEHAPMSDAKRDRSMLPPETTATIFRWPARRIARRARRRDGARRRAFDDDAAAFGDEPHRLRRLIERDDDRLADRALEQRPHRRQHRLAAGAVHERRLPARRSATGAPAATTRPAAPRSPARRRRRARRAATRCITHADAGEQAAAADRRDHRVHVRQVFENLERRPCRCR